MSFRPLGRPLKPRRPGPGYQPIARGVRRTERSAGLSRIRRWFRPVIQREDRPRDPPAAKRPQLRAVKTVQTLCSAIERVGRCELVKEDFHHDVHRQVYGVMLDLHHRGEPVNPASMAAGISHFEVRQATSASGLLAELADSVPHAANAKYYAEIVRDKSIERQIHLCRYGD
jgi:DnaB-like helicase N terminal domain